jgi:hypothetical protein
VGWLLADKLDFDLAQRAEAVSGCVFIWGRQGGNASPNSESSEYSEKPHSSASRLGQQASSTATGLFLGTVGKTHSTLLPLPHTAEICPDNSVTPASIVPSVTPQDSGGDGQGGWGSEGSF